MVGHVNQKHVSFVLFANYILHKIKIYSIRQEFHVKNIQWDLLIGPYKTYMWFIYDYV